MHPAVGDLFLADLGAAQEAVRAAVVDKRARSSDSHWRLWLEFCAEHAVDPWFAEGTDPIPYLQVFAARYRDGRLAPRGNAVRSGTVQDVLRSIGQAYRRMGSSDIRMDAQGDIDFRLSRQLRFYTKQDPPPGRVKPVPIQVVRALLEAAHLHAQPDDALTAIADMTCLGFFFLMRPGEHTVTADNTPFKVRDVKFYIGMRHLLPPAVTNAEWQAVTNISLTFTTQKNGVKGEIIRHGRSGDPLACPVRAMVRRVRYLLNHGASPDTPLCTYYLNNNARHVTSNNITSAVRSALALVDPSTLDISPEDISARSLRAGGATALLCAGVDRDTIQLLGRWQSDAMLRYLHVSAHPVTNQLASAMFAGGSYTFAPGTYVPQAY